jgi:Lar family restriction alleviation protein
MMKEDESRYAEIARKDFEREIYKQCDKEDAELADVGERLLPCPFCGGEAMQARGTDGNDEEYFYIRCKCCAGEGGWDKILNGARMMWNKRANVS